jgi:hypothetical protein
MPRDLLLLALVLTAALVLPFLLARMESDLEDAEAKQRR